MLHGLPLELSVHTEETPYVLRLPSALDCGACAALRAAVDAHLDSKGGSCGRPSAGTDEIRDHMLAQSFASQLVLDRAGLEALIGPRDTASLWRLPAHVRARRDPSSRTRADKATVQAAAAEADGNPNAPEFVGQVEITVRRYAPGARPWVPFHHDRAACTVNVALADDMRHSGGRLLAYISGNGVSIVERAEGEVTAHGPELMHAVTRLVEGSRYSLILFFGPRQGMRVHETSRK